MIEEPDASMPLCFSPENYRAEVTRRKSAERERDDLAKQAERLIEENEKLTANVATLVEQLAEQERVAGVTLSGAEESCRWQADKIRSLVEQRTCTEWERDHLLAALREEQRLADAEGYERIEKAIASILPPERAGVAQPVVEPRDEMKPPPGWRLHVFSDGSTGEHCTRDDLCTLREAWKRHDEECRCAGQ